MIQCKPGKGGVIYHGKDCVSDFVARVEFRVPAGGNNGLAIRYPGQGTASATAMCELQILDDGADQYARLDPRQYHGSVYGMVAARRGYLRPAGEWNFQEVTVEGPRIKVELNGTVIVDADVSKVTEFMGGSPARSKARTSGLLRLRRAQRPCGLPQRHDQAAGLTIANSRGLPMRSAFLLALIVAASGSALADELRVGAASEDIAPPVGTPMAGYDDAPSPTAYLEFIREQARALRAGDRTPKTREEWRDQAEAVRRGLREAWGNFPTPPCALEPRVLGTLDREGYRVERVVFQTRPGVWMTANAYVPGTAGKHPAILAVHGHWRGAKQDPVVQSRCIGAAKLGFFVLAVDAFEVGERGVQQVCREYHGEMTAATSCRSACRSRGFRFTKTRGPSIYLRSRARGGRRADRRQQGQRRRRTRSMYAEHWDDRLKATVPGSCCRRSLLKRTSARLLR